VPPTVHRPKPKLSIEVIRNDTVGTSQRKQRASTRNPSREIIAVYYENYAKHVK